MVDKGTTTGDQFIGCFIAIIIIAVGIYACSPEPTPEELKQDADIARIVEGRMSVLDVLKDPDSADFTNERIGASGAYCASVNAKNSFGGYTGATRVVSLGGQVVIEETADAAGFQRVWTTAC